MVPHHRGPSRRRVAPWRLLLEGRKDVLLVVDGRLLVLLLVLRLLVLRLRLAGLQGAEGPGAAAGLQQALQVRPKWGRGSSATAL